MSKLDGEMLGHLNTVGQLHLLFSSLLLLSTSGVMDNRFSQPDETLASCFKYHSTLSEKNNHRKNMTATCTFRGISL